MNGVGPRTRRARSSVRGPGEPDDLRREGAVDQVLGECPRGSPAGSRGRRSRRAGGDSPGQDLDPLGAVAPDVRDRPVDGADDVREADLGRSAREPKAPGCAALALHDPPCLVESTLSRNSIGMSCRAASAGRFRRPWTAHRQLSGGPQRVVAPCRDTHAAILSPTGRAAHGRSGLSSTRGPRPDPDCCRPADPRIARQFEARYEGLDAREGSRSSSTFGAILDLVRDASLRRPSVLDLGCGTGALGVALLEMGRHA